MTQLNSQLDPVGPRRQRGFGAGGPQVLHPSAGQTLKAYALAGGLLSVYVPSVGQPVTVGYSGGVTSYIPLSCPDPCQFTLDGTTGTLSMYWTDSSNVKQFVNVQVVAAPAPTPPPTTLLPIHLNAGPPAGQKVGGARPAGSPTGGAQPPAPPPTNMSTGSKVAVGAAAVTGASIVTVAIISAVTGWGITKTLDKGWDKISGKKSKR